MHQPCQTFQTKVQQIKDDLEVIELLLLYLKPRDPSPAFRQYFDNAVEAFERIKKELD
jgi:hypothetical protein